MLKIIYILLLFLFILPLSAISQEDKVFKLSVKDITSNYLFEEEIITIKDSLQSRIEFILKSEQYRLKKIQKYEYIKPTSYDSSSKIDMEIIGSININPYNYGITLQLVNARTGDILRSVQRDIRDLHQLLLIWLTN